MANIDNSSKITVPIVISLIGLAFWVGQSYMMVVQNKAQIQANKTQIYEIKKETYEKIDRMSDNLAEINGRLDTMIKLMEKKTKE
jgi:hypothetical protein